MHVARQKIISNRVLLQNAREADIPQYICSKPFIAKTWLPYNFKTARALPTGLTTDDLPDVPEDPLATSLDQPMDMDTEITTLNSTSK